MKHRHGDGGTYEMMCEECERRRRRFEVGAEWVFTLLLVVVCGAIVWRFAV